MSKECCFGRKICLLIFVLLAMCMETYAQTGKIIGKILSSEGKPLELAAVAVKGTRSGGESGEDGTFAIEAPTGNHQIVVTYFGCTPVERNIVVSNGQTTDVGTISIDITSNILNEVVVDGMITKFAQKKSDFVARMPLKNLENPQVYTLVPKELLTEQVAVDIQSALLASPGVGNTTMGPGSGGVGLGINMRGFSSLNGAGAIRNGAATNFVTLSDPANLESLEIIKGPSSTLFGSTLVSYGGLVNRVTKRAFADRAGEAGFSTGSNGLGRVTMDYNTPLNADKTFLFRINTAVHREKSFQDFGVNRTFLVAPTFTYLVNDRLTLDFDFEYFQTERNATYVRVDPKTGVTNMDELNWDFKKSYTSNNLLTESKAFTAYAKATYQLSDQWVSQTLYSYANTENDGNYLFLAVNKPDTISPYIMNIPSTFTTNQIQQNFIGDLRFGSVRNRVLIGLDYTQLVNTNDRATVYLSNVAINGTLMPNVNDYRAALAKAKFSNALRSERTYSAYVSDVLNVTDRLLAMLSLRVDRFHDVEADYLQTAFSPKLGVVYQVVKDKVSLFGNYMDGFKNVAPALTEDDGLTAFKPEHARQWEGGVKLELLGGKLNGTLSYYDINVENRLTPYTISGDKNTYYTQDGTQRSKGFEVDVIANPIPGMHIIMGYGYNDSEYTKGQYEGKRPYGTPEHIANFWLSHKIMNGSLKGFGLGFGGNYASDHFLETTNAITVPGYTKFDATLFYDASKYRIGLKMNNITNEEYWASNFNATPQPTRTFVANITYRF